MSSGHTNVRLSDRFSTMGSIEVVLGENSYLFPVVAGSVNYDVETNLAGVSALYAAASSAMSATLILRDYVPSGS